MSVELLNASLSPVFVASKPLLVVAERALFDFDFAVAAPGLALVEWYIEHTEGDPFNVANKWFREVTPTDTGNGALATFQTVRTFRNTGGGGLPTGAYRFHDGVFTRLSPIVRVQTRATVAGVLMKITAPFGSVPVSSA